MASVLRTFNVRDVGRIVTLDVVCHHHSARSETDALLQHHHLDILEFDRVTFALQGDVAALYR